MFDGVAQENALYNIGHERAKRIWALHHDFFNSFDVILTSDTAPLSRIFLQNGWKKPLIIWICNRFDYYDGASLDCNFPDAEYYQLFANACKQPNVSMIGYTAYEHRYAKLKGINTGTRLIKPTGLCTNPRLDSAIPSKIVKSETFFLPPYHNETNFMNASNYYTQLGIKNYCGKYNGPKDLEEFKAIIHLPYAWSNFALFENLHLGIPYLIPSVKFMRTLIRQNNYFMTSDIGAFRLSEWYAAENAPFFIYFDSWQDLALKANTTNFAQQKETLKQLGHKHAQEMLERWKELFDSLTNFNK